MPVYPGAHRFADIHVSLLSREKKILLTRALGGARTAEPARTCSSHVCLSAVVPAFAEPDIHSLSQVHADRHRRLSVCSLPVLKQFEESLGNLRRSVGNRRTWQSARCVILLFFRRGGSRFLGRYAPRICERYEIALPPDQRRADKPPSSELRPASLDWHFLSVFLFHRPGPDHDSVWVPASRLPPAHAGYVCCAVWNAGCASPCRPSSVQHRRSRSN